MEEDGGDGGRGRRGGVGWDDRSCERKVQEKGGGGGGCCCRLSVGATSLFPFLKRRGRGEGGGRGRGQRAKGEMKKKKTAEEVAVTVAESLETTPSAALAEPFALFFSLEPELKGPVCKKKNKTLGPDLRFSRRVKD